MSKKRIPTQQIKEEVQSYSPSSLEKKAFSIHLTNENISNSYHTTPYVVLKYFQSEWECFSDWEKNELALFSKFLNILQEHTWETVYRSGGKNKTGLGYTPYDIKTAKNASSYLKKIQEKLSEDIQFFELRLSQKIRIHGFQVQSAFFLVLLDREHKVFPD